MSLSVLDEQISTARFLSTHRIEGEGKIYEHLALMDLFDFDDINRVVKFGF